jgi:hypothetical protein
VLAFTQLPNSTSAGNPRFAYRNVTGRDLREAGIIVPDLVGALTGWVTPRGTVNIAAVGPTGELRLFWKAAGQRWTGINLSQQTGLSAVLAGNLASFQSVNKGVTIVGADGAGNTYSVSYRDGQGWRWQSLTGIAGGALQKSSLASWSPSLSAGYVTGVDAQGRAVLFRYDSTSDTWSNVGVSLAAPLQLVAATSAAADLSGSVYVLSTNLGGELTLLRQGAGGQWTGDNLSMLLAA